MQLAPPANYQSTSVPFPHPCHRDLAVTTDVRGSGGGAGGEPVAGPMPKAPRGGGMAGVLENERPASGPPQQLCLLDIPDQGGSGRGAGGELGAEPMPKAPRRGGLAGASETERPASEPPSSSACWTSPIRAGLAGAQGGNLGPSPCPKPHLCLMDTPDQGGSGRGAGGELGAEPVPKDPRRGGVAGARRRVGHWAGVPPERDRGSAVPMQCFTVKVSDSAPQVMELDTSPALIHRSGAEPVGSGDDTDEDEDEESLVPRRDLCVFRLLEARMNAMFPSYRSPTLHKQAMAL
ncbi:hypothetical protein B484DRAFT_411672, partial [Ochromonadaceae sp. CCMP2298]